GITALAGDRVFAAAGNGLEPLPPVAAPGSAAPALAPSTQPSESPPSEAGSEPGVLPVVGGAWVAKGPAPEQNEGNTVATPNNSVMGAIKTIAAHPTNADIIYVGATNGGIWKTT